MILEEAIKILDNHQKWRRGEIEDWVSTPKELGEAIDLILTTLKNNNQQEG